MACRGCKKSSCIGCPKLIGFAEGLPIIKIGRMTYAKKGRLLYNVKLD